MAALKPSTSIPCSRSASVCRPLAALSAERPAKMFAHSTRVLAHGRGGALAPLPGLLRRCSTSLRAAAAAEVADPSQQGADEKAGRSTAYPFTDIEAKWQRYWADNRTFRTPDDVDMSKPKYYVLDMFPYPRWVEGWVAAIE